MSGVMVLKQASKQASIEILFTPPPRTMNLCSLVEFTHVMHCSCVFPDAEVGCQMSDVYGCTEYRVLYGEPNLSHL